MDSEQFAQLLYERQGVEVLPGTYLARSFNGVNAGADRVRIALVASTRFV